MPVPSRRVALVIAALVAAVAVWLYLRPAPPAPVGPPPVPLSPSPYLNTGPDAAYVGSAACVRCHEGEHTSYQRTGMARSTAAVDPNAEPADAAFTHAPSGRRYEVVRQDGQVRHRELLPRGDGPPLTANDVSLRYAVGSGRHARTYLAELDGFLVESPVSWYRSRGWAMSPGYDHPGHVGFERPVGDLCLSCHVGRSEIEGESLHRHAVLEPGIGCERCHGPGSLHVAARDKGEPAPPRPEGDLTIVNPKRLSRDLAEAVCQQCHLSADLVVRARGRRVGDFRPGLPLQDVRHVYQPAGDMGGMTVTGHVEQLHQSACYQKSATLTCATCHNPHGFPEPVRKVAHYRAACLACHAEAACKVEPERRRREAPGDDCAKCHMPTGATDIPHVAFSHHRIGVHPAAKPLDTAGKAAEPAEGREALRPFHDLSRFDEADRRRSLGLAYARSAAEPANTAADAHGRRARELLTEAWAAGYHDGATAAALAATHYRLGRGVARDYAAFAEAALADPVGLDGEDRCMALFLLADDRFKGGDAAGAAELLRRLTRLRRNAVDWAYLARCERAAGREAEGLAALEEAARIGGAAPRHRAELVELYDGRGDRARADRHRQYLTGDGRR